MRTRQRNQTSWKRWAYSLIVLTAAAGAAWLLAPAFWSDKPLRAGAAVVEIKGTMGGFSASVIRAKAGRPLTVRLTLPLLGILLPASARPTLNRLAHWNLHHREWVRLGLGTGVVLMGFAILVTV